MPPHLTLPLLLTLSPAAAWWVGMNWLTPVGVIVVLPILEWLIGRSRPAKSERATDVHDVHHWGVFFPRLLAVLVLLQWALMCTTVSRLDWVQTLWLSLSIGLVAGSVGLVLAHELGHRRNQTDTRLAQCLLVLLAFGHYRVAHQQGHHRLAGTPEDAATARREENLFQFMIRYLPAVLRTGMSPPGRALSGARGVWLQLAGTAALWSLAGMVGGHKALVLCAIQACTAQYLIATVDYMQHWGLERAKHDDRHERLHPGHVWDCNNRVSCWLLMNLPRHTSHHLRPWQTADELVHTPEPPQLPTGYAGMVILASMPWLYRKVMAPRLPK